MDDVTLEKINKTNNNNPKGDLIFVHGLDGNLKGTWTNSNGDFWPEWLTEDFPELNVWTLGYNAASTVWTGKAFPLQTRAKNVLERLVLTEQIGSRPICFITHSLGGLLVKQLLLTADSMNIDRYKKIVNSTRGVVFIATPHDGAGLANLVNFFKPFLRPNITVEQLMKNNSYLEDLRDWYSNNARRLRIETFAFHEGYPTKNVWIVNEASARPGIEGTQIIGIDADHIQICKPVDNSKLIYVSIKNFIETIVNSLDDSLSVVEKELTSIKAKLAELEAKIDRSMSFYELNKGN